MIDTASASEEISRASDVTPLATVSRAARALVFVLFAIHCILRIGGLEWNLQHHSAFPQPQDDVPTYHVDEQLLVQSMRTDFRLFSSYAMVVDGPLSANLIYLPLAAGSEHPPLRWNPAHVLLAGRLVAAISACLAFPALWLLLAELGVGKAIRVFALAVVAFAPNEVFNAHFARSHTLANLLQIVVLLATAKLMDADTRGARCGWFAIATLSSVLAGSARYPFLTLGLFPAAAGMVLLVRLAKSRLWPEIAALALSGAVALVVGLLLGFDLRPIDILRKAVAYQAAVGQLAWSDVRGIALSARGKLFSVFDFPGGAARCVLALASPFALGRGAGGNGTRSRFIVALLLVWAALYLALWAKFAVPWQRYSIPFSTALLVTGSVGLERLMTWARSRFHIQHLRLASVVVAVLLLAAPAYFSALIFHRFVADTTNPLYALSLALRGEQPRQVFLHGFWQWNTPLRDVMPPDRFTLRFVGSMQEACALASDGDLVVNLVFEPLRGSCPQHGLVPVFHTSNLGPPGFPYPRDHDATPWMGRHYEDYHYLFEEVTVSRLVANRDR